MRYYLVFRFIFEDTDDNAVKYQKASKPTIIGTDGDDEGKRKGEIAYAVLVSALMLFAKDMEYCTIFQRRRRAGVLSASAGAKESVAQRKRLKRRA